MLCPSLNKNKIINLYAYFIQTLDNFIEFTHWWQIYCWPRVGNKIPFLISYIVVHDNRIATNQTIFLIQQFGIVGPNRNIPTEKWSLENEARISILNTRKVSNMDIIWSWTYIIALVGATEFSNLMYLTACVVTIGGLFQINSHTVSISSGRTIRTRPLSCFCSVSTYWTSCAAWPFTPKAIRSFAEIFVDNVKRVTTYIFIVSK